MTRRRGGSEEGLGAVYVLLAVSVLMSVSLVGLALLDVAIARRRAASGADLAAIAGAQAAVTSAWSGVPPEAGGGVPCATARRVATAQGTALAACRLGEDGVLDVVVTAEVGPWLAAFMGEGRGRAAAQARAGPPAPPWGSAVPE